MKILVVHDENGRVKSVGVPAEQFAGRVHLVPDEGETVSEIEVSDVQGQTRLDDLDEDGKAQHILDLVEHHRIEMTDTGPKLVPRQLDSRD